MRYYAAILTAIVLAGVVRIALTYRVFCETLDEPAHIAAGMEWLDRGTYRTDIEHPPLARVAAALGPFLAGIRSIPTRDFVVAGNSVLYAGGHYLRNLSLARIGILPFFIVATITVAAWARRLWGEPAALVAAALFSNEPTVLAHAGLVTTDMAATAATIVAAYVFWRWLHGLEKRPGTPLTRPSASPLPAGEGAAQHPSVNPLPSGEGAAKQRVRGVQLRITLALGAVLGFALLAKFSTLLFVPAALAAVLAAFLASGRRVPLRAAAISLAGAAVTGALIVSIGYRFSLGDLFRGIAFVAHHARAGHTAYFFGEFRTHGWLLYFPVAIALKTTIGFLALLAAGIAMHTRRIRDESAGPVAAGILILIASMPSTIDIGVRHVLPAYPFFAMTGGAALVHLWNGGVHRWIAEVLAIAAAVASLAAHPDYLPYFNAMAGPRPDKILIDSNLDWGQDLLRLQQELRRRQIDRIALAYIGTAIAGRHDMPAITRLDPFRYTPGWAAISESCLHSPGMEYRWLDLFNPVTRVGKSIRLYYIPRPDVLAGRAFRFESGNRDRTMVGILVPIWFQKTFHGTGSWTCELTIDNDGDHPITLRAQPLRNGRAVATVDAGQRVVNPLPFDAPNGVMLFVPESDASSIHLSLKLQSARGDDVAIPIIRENQATASHVEFGGVPAGPGSNVTLRIYDLAGFAENATVRLIQDGRTSEVNVALARPDTCPQCLTSMTVAMKNAFPAARRGSGRVSVSAGSGSLAAFMTVTDTTRPVTSVLPAD